MGKDAAKPTKTRGRKARGRAPLEETNVCNRRRRVVKRKATEGEGTSMVKGRRHSSAGKASCSTSVKEVAVRKRKAVAEAEGANRRKKRRVALKDIEQKAPKRVAVAEAEAADRRKKRRVALKDIEQKAPKRVAVAEVEGADRRKKRRVALKDTEQKTPKRVMVGKRKAVADTEDTNRRKKRRVALMDTEEEVPTLVAISDVERADRRKKRRVALEDTEEEVPTLVAIIEVEGADRRKKRRDLKDTKQEAPKKVSVRALQAQFKAKYRQEKKVGEGAFGCVFAGYRKEDSLPVAIKHVRKKDILYEDQEDAGRKIPIEVAVMLRLQEHPSSSAGASAPVALLDWYQMGQELIMVHERPVPCQTMMHHLRGNGGSIPEAEAKIIFNQLVDAAIYLQKKQVFHRDIHQANVLIETSSDIPRVRFIDFGVSCFAKEGDSFHKYLGNSNHAAPECRRQYHAGPFTVWQIGMLLYESLHPNSICWTEKILDGSLKISKTLSLECQDFLRLCLIKDPEERATLQRLRVHAWLQ
ncbi:uncharacterized protein [Clinocottus analis]|uniref:uncharacterized protein n=1 Tax=Clinocottus analis TaxID=304258 RepID=UPI0035BFAC15